MTDCEHPKCHETMSRRIDARVKFDTFNDLKACVLKKVPKKTLWVVCWAVFVVIAIPLFITGINVWSQQEADHLQYAQKEDMIKVQVIIEHLSKDIKEIKQDIKAGYAKAQTDREAMLKLLRER